MPLLSCQQLADIVGITYDGLTYADSSDESKNFKTISFSSSGAQLEKTYTFYKVQEFKLGNINNFYKIFLEIIDVTDRHLEEIRYYVDEIEYNMISFACVDFKYELL